MGRAPCCDKVGLKRGPWTPEEDQVLISYILRNGHGNWRALPKQAGLLRCGKSCRLRWTNYLRPDIKRGNFTREEEDIIINLHELLGNRWSAIAARLPGRTDNEIKNVWHTHLKKRLKQTPVAENQPIKISKCNADSEIESIPKTLELNFPITTHETFENPGRITVSPEQSCSDFSSSSLSYSTDSSSVLTSKNQNTSLTTSTIEDADSFESMHDLCKDWSESFDLMDDLLSEALPEETTSTTATATAATTAESLQFLLGPCSPSSQPWPQNPYNDKSVDFWYNILMGTGQWPELPEF